jgi:ribosomal protein L29
MKLRMLAVAAGFVVLPAIAVAQTPTDTTAKDTTMKMPAAPAAAVTTAAKDSTLEPKPVPPSDGTTCPWGCPTSSGAAGLTGPQFLALQQELRDARQELFQNRVRYATRALDNPEPLRKGKKKIARILTYIRQRELAEQHG